MRKILALLVFLPGVSFAQAPISLAEAVELGCHRIERLVNIHKIDKTFIDKLQVLDLAKMGGPSYKVVGSQVPGPNGQANQIDVFLDSVGKATPYDPSHLHAGTDAPSAPMWPDKDAVTLLENSIHFIEAGKTDSILKMYYDGLVQISLSQVAGTGGQIFGRVLMKSEQTPKLLEVVLRVDGNV